jgi:hypothetical protein
MHRDVQCHTPPNPKQGFHLFLRVLHRNAWGATDSRAGLYRRIRHGNITEVVLANSLDGVCVCGASLIYSLFEGPV